VLRYLPTHLSAPEIGAELSVSTSTVKTHMRNLYTKLGAHSRAEAVERARALGLLAPRRARLRPLDDHRVIMGYAACRKLRARRRGGCERSCLPSGAVAAAGGSTAGDGGVGAPGQRQDRPAAVLDR
jgi:hypothetical protein